MLSSFANLFRDRELRRRLLVTLGILVVYRFGATLPLPQVDPDVVAKHFGSQVFQLVNMVSGGALGRGSVFGLGIMPYIAYQMYRFMLSSIITYRRSFWQMRY